VLSLYASARKIIQPKYTMQDFNWLDFSKGGKQGWGFLRAVRVCLTDNLPNILPTLTTLVRAEISNVLFKHRIDNAGANQVSLHALVLRLVVVSNVAAIFGPDLGKSSRLFFFFLLLIMGQKLTHFSSSKPGIRQGCSRLH